MTAEIHRHAVKTFAETASSIEQERKKAKNTTYQDQVERFCDFVTSLSSKQLAGDITVGATAIAQIINSSPYPPEPEKRRGFMARLLGL